MKFLIVTHNISAGGAATACRRLINAFSSQDIEVELLSVKEKKTSNLLSRSLYRIYSGFLSKLDIQICKFLSNGSPHWQSSGLIGLIKAKQLETKSPTVVNIHWIGHATISIRQLRKLNGPIVITMHDEWWLNALNHYQAETEFHRNSPLKNAVIRHILNEKLRLLASSNVTLVCPNKELRQMLIATIPAKEKQIHQVPNPVPTNLFFPRLNSGKRPRTVLFAGGTQDPRKGYDLLVDTLRTMKEECEVIVLGKSGVETTGSKHQIKIVGKPWVKSEMEMNRIYGRSCLTIVPSRQEAFGQVACESIMSGTPVASFEVGGLKDIIIDGLNGLKAENFDTLRLGHKIDQFLRSGTVDHSKIAADAKLRFSEETVVNAYLKIIK
jgi:glycosyltransferase involved in cell wall biosynthesis